MQTVVGISIGGTNTSLCLGNGHGLLDQSPRDQFPTETSRGPEPVIQRLRETIERLRRATPIDGIGIALGCPCRPGDGIVLEAKPLATWTGCNVKKAFQEYGPVFVMNDADAGALAEMYWGAARGAVCSVFLTFGTGLGAGIIDHGRLIQGATPCAGEVAHMALPREPHWLIAEEVPTLEGICSGLGINKILKHALENSASIPPDLRVTTLTRDSTAKDVFRAAAAGDVLGQAIVQTVGEALGYGVRNLTTILNPGTIVIGGIYARQEPVLKPFVDAALRKLGPLNPHAARAVTVVPAQLGEQISFYQSVAVARYRFLEP